MNKTISAIIALMLCSPVFAGRDSGADALLLIPSESVAFDINFQKFLNDGGARLLDEYAPNVFMGYIPKDMDGELKRIYGARVYRDKITYMEDFAPYGDKAMLAVTRWNKTLQEDPEEAPLIIKTSVKKTGRRGRGLKL